MRCDLKVLQLLQLELLLEHLLKPRCALSRLLLLLLQLFAVQCQQILFLLQANGLQLQVDKLQGVIVCLTMVAPVNLLHRDHGLATKRENLRNNLLLVMLEPNFIMCKLDGLFSGIVNKSIVSLQRGQPRICAHVSSAYSKLSLDLEPVPWPRLGGWIAAGTAML